MSNKKYRRETNWRQGICSYDKGHVAVIIETHKACLNVKATGARSMRVVEILTEDGKEVKEGEPLLMVEKA